MRAWTSPCGGATPTRFRLSTVAKTRRICRASRCLSVLQPRRISQRRWQVSHWSSLPSPSRPCARHWKPHARPSCPMWPSCPWLRASNWAPSSASTRSSPMPRVCPTAASPCSPARTCRAKSLSASPPRRSSPPPMSSWPRRSRGPATTPTSAPMSRPTWWEPRWRVRRRTSSPSPLVPLRAWVWASTRVRPSSHAAWPR